MTEMGKHHGHHSQAVSVEELLTRAVERGWPLGLNWRARDMGRDGLVRIPAQEEWPTGAFPRITEEMLNDKGNSATESAVTELPRRERRDVAAPDKPIWFQQDREFLDRVLQGLQDWE